MASRFKPLSESIEYLEHKLCIYNAVLNKFNDAKIKHNSYTIFSSKSVNAEYTDLQFQKTRNCLYVVPFFKMNFSYKGKEEIIKIYCSPNRTRLARIPYVSFDKVRQAKATGKEYKRQIVFSRLKINLENNCFNDSMIRDCNAEIMKFIQENPSCELNTKYLDPKLKKLLIFT